MRCGYASILDIDVPVYQGCGQAMIRERVTSPEIHGESGLDGPVFCTVEPQCREGACSQLPDQDADGIRRG